MCDPSIYNPYRHPFTPQNSCHIIYVYIYIYDICNFRPFYIGLRCIKKKPPLNILSNEPACLATALLVGGGAISALGGFQLLNGLLFINDAVAWNSGGAEDSQATAVGSPVIPETNSKQVCTWTYGWFGIYGICIRFQILGWPVFWGGSIC